MDDKDVRALVQFLLDRLEGDTEEVLEWFFLEHGWGSDRRQEVLNLVYGEED